MAVEMALSVIARPIAGVLSDLFERRYVAATGAVLYAASAAGYALAQNAAAAYAAAAVGGVGGALLWVAVRAIISERLAEDSAVFPRLLASQETGSWVAFIAGMVLIGEIGFDGSSGPARGPVCSPPRCCSPRPAGRIRRPCGAGERAVLRGRPGRRARRPRRGRRAWRARPSPGSVPSGAGSAPCCSRWS
ncbi:hypothetical protein SMD44_08287 [Streptomyces alboflavus]|uniref:MFS transporter n=1 Tax=Streptomyces alboflavus TaxID=67267 RepID=A0A1Z1WQW4_9ACTN|nr:MFS transporter [Streptomyces alboflavus]ARX88800.1 hypothetical protein SMD44_08287 [Streptomyces alboflavus]